MNYSAIFTTVNQGFVNAGNWIGNAAGIGNLFENWKNDISTQYSQDGVQQMWGLVTGSIAGAIDGILILVAYILYPFVIAIFGFFYVFYGSCPLGQRTVLPRRISKMSSSGMRGPSYTEASALYSARSRWDKSGKC
jgi:hypothetical protein